MDLLKLALALAGFAAGCAAEPAERAAARIAPAAQSAQAAPAADSKGATMDKSSAGERANRTDEEWREALTAEQYHVLRQAGTERAFTGRYWNHKEDGTYTCAGCGQVLFTSKTKFDSGCGWPSFYDAVAQGNIETREDRSHGMLRTEVLCKRCGGHLGHVFEDGPNPTGLRYCINSASLTFVKRPGGK